MNETFWNERFAADDFVYGTAPNAFLAAEAHRLPKRSRVADLGAGEGRNAVYLAERGHHVVAVDAAEEGLAKARRLAADGGVAIETARADVLAWAPEEPLDAVVMAFLHLPSALRPALYDHVQALLRPGGLVLAEWFRPEQLAGGYPSGGPRSLDLLVTEDELRRAFDPDGVELLEATETVLDEGPYHQGPAAVVRLVWRRP